jgi:XTP/dITP diphosphohydrolase
VKILVGTTNPGKLLEVEAILKDLPLEVVSLTSLGTRPKIVEDGESFEENAKKKALTLAEFSGHVTLADDSGLEVDALGGAPGIFSARYGGEEADDLKNNEKLLRELARIPLQERGARFVCVIALCAPISLAGAEWVFRGECEGWITFIPKGENGFGYDPLFFYPPFGKTFGELDRETKSLVSHRGKALKKFKEALPSLFSLGGKP